MPVPRNLRCRELPVFPDAVNSICQAYTVQRGSCPYVETLLIYSCGQIPVSLSSEPQDIPSAASDLRDINWSREQLPDSAGRFVSPVCISR